MPKLMAYFVAILPALLQAAHAVERSSIRKTSFLQATDAAAFRSQLHHAIEDSRATRHGIERQQEVQRLIMPLWDALAKNSEGRIEQRSLRYAVHRFIHRAHGIAIIGFEASHSNHTEKAAELLALHAPAPVKALLVNATAANGYSLQDLVAMIVLFESLLHSAAHDLLDSVVTARGWGEEPRWRLPPRQFQEIMRAFFFELILGDDAPSIEAFRADPGSLDGMFDEIHELTPFIDGRVEAHTASWWKEHTTGMWSPMNPQYSYDDARHIAAGTFLTLNKWWAADCSSIKAALQKMDPHRTGRVPLTSFHAALLDGDWHFSESKEYLQHLGVLDETSAVRGPRVIIPNYLQSASNCFPTTPHFRICCKNDCEEYMDELETQVRSPLATPEQVLDAMKDMTSSMEDDAPLVTRSMRSQLSAIADVHGGKVPLHGRLFAQWMHYVFPHECPYPNKAGTVNASSPLEFGSGFIADVHEAKRHAAQVSKAPTTEAESPCEQGHGNSSGVACHHDDRVRLLEEEELLMPHTEIGPGGTVAHFLILVATLVAFAAACVEASSQRWEGDSLRSGPSMFFSEQPKWSAKSHLV